MNNPISTLKINSTAYDLNPQYLGGRPYSEYQNAKVFDAEDGFWWEDAMYTEWGYVGSLGDQDVYIFQTEFIARYLAEDHGGPPEPVVLRNCVLVKYDTDLHISINNKIVYLDNSIISCLDEACWTPSRAYVDGCNNSSIINLNQYQSVTPNSNRYSYWKSTLYKPETGYQFAAGAVYTNFIELVNVPAKSISHTTRVDKCCIYWFDTSYHGYPDIAEDMVSWGNNTMDVIKNCDSVSNSILFLPNWNADDWTGWSGCIQKVNFITNLKIVPGEYPNYGARILPLELEFIDCPYLSFDVIDFETDIESALSIYSSNSAHIAFRYAGCTKCYHNNMPWRDNCGLWSQYSPSLIPLVATSYKKYYDTAFWQSLCATYNSGYDSDAIIWINPYKKSRDIINQHNLSNTWAESTWTDLGYNINSVSSEPDSNMAYGFALTQQGDASSEDGHSFDYPGFNFGALWYRLSSITDKRIGIVGLNPVAEPLRMVIPQWSNFYSDESWREFYYLNPEGYAGSVQSYGQSWSVPTHITELIFNNIVASVRDMTIQRFRDGTGSVQIYHYSQSKAYIIFPSNCTVRGLKLNDIAPYRAHIDTESIPNGVNVQGYWYSKAQGTTDYPLLIPEVSGAKQIIDSDIPNYVNIGQVINSSGKTFSDVSTIINPSIYRELDTATSETVSGSSEYLYQKLTSSGAQAWGFNTLNTDVTPVTVTSEDTQTVIYR